MSASGMAHRARRDTEVVKAMTTLLNLWRPKALLDDVIQEYFCEPDPQDEDEDSNPEESLAHEDGQAALELEGTLQHQ